MNPVASAPLVPVVFPLLEAMLFVTLRILLVDAVRRFANGLVHHCAEGKQVSAMTGAKPVGHLPIPTAFP